MSYTVPWTKIRRYKSRTIPHWLDPDTELCPDIVIIQGLSSSDPNPTKPSKKVRITLADALYSREGDFERAAWRKADKYEHLLAKWKRQGWQVDGKIRLIMIGHRGGIPNRTIKDINALQTGRGSRSRMDSQVMKFSNKLSILGMRRLASLLRTRRYVERNYEEVKARSAVGRTIWKQQEQDWKRKPQKKPG